MSALLRAIAQERMYQIKILMLRNDLDLNYFDGNGQTALMKCNFMNDKWKTLAVTKILLNHNCDVSLKDRYGRTALTYACIRGNYKVAKLLIESEEVEPNSKDIYSLTNLMYSVFSNDEKIVRLLVQYLQKYKINLDERTRNGFTAYMFAIKKENTAIVDILKNAGVSTDIFDFENFIKCKDFNNRVSMQRSKTAKAIPVLKIKDHQPLRRSYTAPNDMRALRNKFAYQEIEHQKSAMEKQQKSLNFYGFSKNDNQNPFHNSDMKYANLNEFIALFEKKNKQKMKRTAFGNTNINFHDTIIEEDKKPLRKYQPFRSASDLCGLLNESIISKEENKERENRIRQVKNDKKILQYRQRQLEKLKKENENDEDGLGTERRPATGLSSPRRRSNSTRRRSVTYAI